MIDAGKFGRKIPVAGGGNFRFGIIDRGEVAQVLRKMADSIESGAISVQNVQTGQVSKREEYYTQAIMIEFIEREVS